MSPEERLKWIIEEIRTMNDENEHTHVPRSDLRLLASEIIRLQADLEAVRAENIVGKYPVLGAMQLSRIQQLETENAELLEQLNIKQ